LKVILLKKVFQYSVEVVTSIFFKYKKGLTWIYWVIDTTPATAAWELLVMVPIQQKGQLHWLGEESQPLV